MKLSSIKNGEHFIYNGTEYEKLFSGFVSSARNLTTNKSESFFGKTNVERPSKNKVNESIEIGNKYCNNELQEERE